MEVYSQWSTFAKANRTNFVRCSIVDQEKTSLYLVMAHEIGHVLGLRHSYSRDSLMFAWYNENTTATPNLSQEDESILTQLYTGNLENCLNPLAYLLFLPSRRIFSPYLCTWGSTGEIFVGFCFGRLWQLMIGSWWDHHGLSSWKFEYYLKALFAPYTI